MPRKRSVHRYLSAVFTAAALALSASPAGAAEETYGQIARFGATGTLHGQFDIRKGDNAFGVDQTDNSVYVGDEPGAKKGEYRIQKLTAAGAYIAQTALIKPPSHIGLQGIAVDPVQKRIYVLVVEPRAATLTIDPSVQAAGTLYAFSTEPSEETLVPAPGTNAEGVLTGPSAFQSQSEVPGQALLNPKGIAVDPTTHEVIVLGEVDQGIEGPGKEPSTQVALQRILPNGTLGERYVDSTEFFGPNAAPTSPVVSSGGDVYVAIEQSQKLSGEGKSVADELAQIPSSFTSTAPPTIFAQMTLRGELEDEIQPVAEFSSNELPEFGGGLSFTSEGPQGKSALYAKAGIFVHTGETGGSFYPGALAFDAASGSEIGWTGGQTKQFGTSCTVGFGGIAFGTTYSSVAAGGKGMVFIFSPASQFAPASEVVVLGPGGSGCPTSAATEPRAETDGKLLPSGETVSAGVPVTFSSAITQANALSVEWDFGDGQSKTESTDEYQYTEATHAFVRGGELTVTETIHTDDLATPTIVKTTKISISATAPPPTGVLEGPTNVTLGQTELERIVYLPGGGLGVEKVPRGAVASFDASASTASAATGPNRIAAYYWVFGDGESQTTSTATVEHEYKSVGGYKVELTVTDAFGQTSQPITLTVEVKDPPQPPPPKGAPGTDTPATTAPPQVPTAEKATAGTSGHGSAPVPDAHLASTSLTVDQTGAVKLGVTCPAGESACVGTVTLRTLGAVKVNTASSHSKKKTKATVLTLASGIFTVTGGRQTSVVLHLTTAARSLLAASHAVRARATLVAHDPLGATHSTQALVTLLAPKRARSRHKR